MTEYRPRWSTRNLDHKDHAAVQRTRKDALDEAQTDNTTKRLLEEYCQPSPEPGIAEVRDRPFGVGGRATLLEVPCPKDAASRYFAIRSDQFVTRTEQVLQAITWMRSLRAGRVRGDATVVEHDHRLGVTLMQASGVVGKDLYEAMVRLADAKPADLSGGPGNQRLLVSPNDIVMRAWKVKASDSPQHTDVDLGPRPKDTGLGKGVTVGVIDGGFEPRGNRRTDGWDDLWIPPGEGDEPLDEDQDGHLDSGAGHGTFVSGIVSQVAPDVTIRQYRAMDSYGFGNAWRVKQCINDAIDDGCDVINLSLGSDDPDLLGSLAVSACLHRVPSDIAVVAAAGNDGIRFPPMPAATTAALAVGALDLRLEPETWSNYGTWVDASTVGTVVSTFVRDVKDPSDNPVRLWAGTSFAAPQVSGFLAIQLGRGLSVAKAWDRLRRRALNQTGSPLPDYGHRLRIL